jgi:hypothetical protein
MNGISTSFSGIITKKRDCSFGGGAGTKGDCFTVSTKSEIEKTATCFSLATFDRPCFFIKCEEFYDEIITPEEVDFGELGFVNVKCVQAAGLNNIFIVGTVSDGETQTEVLANVLHIPATDGGISKLQSIYQSVPLSSFDTIEFGEVTRTVTLSDVDRLDGWDIQSSTSSICLVLTDNTAIWINPVSLSETDRQSDGGADPYFDEDTYSVAGTKTSVESYSKTWQSVSTDYRMNDIPYEAAFDYFNKDIGNVGMQIISPTEYYPGYPITFSNNNTETTFSTLGAKKYTVLTKKQNDASEIDSGLSNSFAKNIRSLQEAYFKDWVNVLATGNTCAPLDREVVRKRGSALIFNEASTGNKFLLRINADDLRIEHVYGILAIASSIRDTVTGVKIDNNITNSHNTNRMVASLSDNDILPLGYMPTYLLDGGKISKSDTYFAVWYSTTMRYFRLDGTKTTSIANAKNSTLVKGVAIVADGTPIVKQTVLDDV